MDTPTYTKADDTTMNIVTKIENPVSLDWLIAESARLDEVIAIATASKADKEALIAQARNLGIKTSDEIQVEQDDIITEEDGNQI